MGAGAARIIIPQIVVAGQTGQGQHADHVAHDGKQNGTFKPHNEKGNQGHNRLAADNQTPAGGRENRQRQPADKADNAAAQGKITDRAFV